MNRKNTLFIYDLKNKGMVYLTLSCEYKDEKTNLQFVIKKEKISEIDAESKMPSISFILFLLPDS